MPIIQYSESHTGIRDVSLPEGNDSVKEDHVLGLDGLGESDLRRDKILDCEESSMVSMTPGEDIGHGHTKSATPEEMFFDVGQ